MTTTNGKKKKKTPENTDEVEIAFERALHYLKFRPRSRAEMIRYFEKKQFGRQAIKKTLKKLENYRYIDDESFARFWVDSRKKHRPRGIFALRWELKEKGIDEQLIEKALSDYDESEAAWKAVSARLPAWSKLPEFDLKVKIHNFLKQRGFAFITCAETIDMALQSMPEEKNGL